MSERTCDCIILDGVLMQRVDGCKQTHVRVENPPADGGTDARIARIDAQVKSPTGMAVDHRDVEFLLATITALQQQHAVAEEDLACAYETSDSDAVVALRAQIAEQAATITALSQEKKIYEEKIESDARFVFAVATESADELVKICGISPPGDSARLNYLAEIFAPDPDDSDAERAVINDVSLGPQAVISQLRKELAEAEAHVAALSAENERLTDALKRTEVADK